MTTTGETEMTPSMQKAMALLDAEKQEAMAHEKALADAARLVTMGVAADFAAIRAAEIAGTITAERADHLRDQVHVAEKIGLLRLGPQMTHALAALRAARALAESPLAVRPPTRDDAVHDAAHRAAASAPVAFSKPGGDA
jgi:hypothetical protein